MIQYETEGSSFYEANKNYCEEVEAQLVEENYTYSGYCNSFGYEIDASKTDGELRYNIKFEKHQTTQNGVIFPVGANDYAGSQFKVEGIKNKHNITISKSKLKRFFNSARAKNLLPAPYFSNTNSRGDFSKLSKLSELVVDNNISSLILKNGVLKFFLHHPHNKPIELIANIQDTIN